MKCHSLSRLAAVALLSFGAPLLAAPTLQLDPTTQKLIGAEGVTVDGRLYNVAFQQGTCSEVYADCSVSGFTFKTVEAAVVASQALMDFVFVGRFDSSDGNLPILGCTSAWFQGCTAMTPYAVAYRGDYYGYEVDVSYAVNGRLEEWDMVNRGSSRFDHDTRLRGEYLWAVWTDVTPVPEPDSLALAGIAAVGLIVTRRPRKTAGPARTNI